MRILVGSQEMKEYDRYTIEHLKMPSVVLMERAAVAAVDEILKQKLNLEKCLIVCGLGNNGGDGLAIGRILFQRGYNVTVVCDMKREKATEETILQYEILQQYGVPVVSALPKEEYTLIIDSIFGVGLCREVEGHWKQVIEELNEKTGHKVAIDIPSGIDGTTGQCLGCGFDADLTITFGFLKTGLLLFPGAAYAGKVIVKDMGIDKFSLGEKKPELFSFQNKDLSWLPKRKTNSNKGTYGRVFVIAGKCNMAGAAYFSGKAALMTGCGLVKIMTPEENRIIIQQLLPEAILETWWDGQVEESDFLEKLEESFQWADVIVAGPGLGTGKTAQKLIEEVLKQQEKPVVFDADALSLLPRMYQQLQEMKGKRIVTPHPKEMEILTGIPVSTQKKDMIKVAREYAKEYHVICVLKDARTVTALPDGRCYINTSGNQGMATAGAGDVLTGVIASLIAQGMEGEEAAPFGVYLHGLAGDVMLEETGGYSMMATDIIAGIKKVTRKEGKKS